MKQVIQNLRTGKMDLTDVPCPQVTSGHLLIQTSSSLISAGTERSLVEFSKASLVAKARQQPDRVKQVLNKIRSDGLLPTLEAVFARLDQPLPLGYCNAGTIIEVGANVGDFEVGQRVASNGPHAEIVQVPVNLCAPIPATVADDHAAFAIVSSIGLQGIRLSATSLGESVVVYGLGLVGLLAVQMLKSSGARVLGIDLDPRRLELAKQFGVTTVEGNVSDPVAIARQWSEGYGVDGVLITASAKEDSIIHEASAMCRKRGRIVLVGDVNLKLMRADFYEKELSFQVSCSYGPGRYDAEYEQEGRDYPLPFVRWTENRNIRSVLNMMASGQLDVEPLITSRIAHAEAARAYEALTTDRSQLGIVLQYPQQLVSRKSVISVAKATSKSVASPLAVGILGAGNFTQRVVLPELSRVDVRLIGIASAGGVTAAHAAKKFDIEVCTSDYRSILDNHDVNAVFITTRHHLHARMIVESMEAGKHVFVEKPIGLNEDELMEVRQTLENHASQQFLVGFNRRFSPHAVKMHDLLSNRAGPLCATALINAGKIPVDAWVHDPQVGGGRLVGEVCHWIDLFVFLIRSHVVRVQTSMIGINSGNETRDDHVTVSLNFADGSLANIQYFANGPKSFPKERIEVFQNERALQLDNFRILRGFGWKSFRKHMLMRQDKGHRAEIAQFVQRVGIGGTRLISVDEIVNVTLASFAAQRSAWSGEPEEVVLT